MPTALVYNDFLRELGGGERSTLAYAKALQALGYDTAVVASSELPTRSELLAHFGDEFASVPIRRVLPSELERSTHGGTLAVFVNHTFMSFLPNPATLGLYSQMFPARVLRAPRDRRELDAMATYQLILNNSQFTERYTQRHWGVASTRLAVLRPPIGQHHVEQAARTTVAVPPKRKQLLNVGRFNPDGHLKNQVLIIDTFLEAAARSPSLQRWHLVLAGTVGPQDYERDYFDRCVARAARSGGCVSVKGNVSSAELSELLSQSFGYIHATGAFLAPEVAPERCEHFGLSIVEAMAHGCVAAAFGRGGIWEIARDNPGVRPFSTRADLIDSYDAIAALFGTPLAHDLARRNAAAAATLGFDRFQAELERLLTRAASGLQVDELTVVPRATAVHRPSTRDDHHS
jgi:glycosyltransferase involved in cell wall biosynthesis